MKNFLIKPRIVPPLDKDFMPAVLANHAFLDAVRNSGKAIPLVIGLERSDGSLSVFHSHVFQTGSSLAKDNFSYVVRLITFLLWQRGGYKVIIGGPP
ncbi:MAG: ROK family protein, partial [Candidatus Omnitrophica bacterium]|nr:ROK family protein [Candidatus Omnitrophota bacterium]